MRTLPFFAILAGLALAHPAAATPITYTESGLLSGSLNGTSLFNIAFSFTFNGDTAGIYSFGANLLNPVVSNSFTIGATNGSFTESLVVGVGGNAVGFANPTVTKGITLFPTGGLGSYGLASNASFTGPTQGALGTYSTTAGSLVVSGASNLAFSSVVLTPEPATLGLSAMALLGIAFVRRRRL